MVMGKKKRNQNQSKLNIPTSKHVSAHIQSRLLKAELLDTFSIPPKNVYANFQPQIMLS